jgi:CRP-like cAMP-binding protein
VETLNAPDTLAGPVFFDDRPTIPVTLTAVDDSDVVEMERREVETLADAYPSIYRLLLHDAGGRISFLSAKLRLASFTTLRQKISGYLLMQPSRIDGGAEMVRLYYDREALASLFGVARPSLSRALGEMVSEGHIVVKGRRVWILSREALRRRLE